MHVFVFFSFWINVWMQTEAGSAKQQNRNVNNNNDNNNNNTGENYKLCQPNC